MIYSHDMSETLPVSLGVTVFGQRATVLQDIDPDTEFLRLTPPDGMAIIDGLHFYSRTDVQPGPAEFFQSDKSPLILLPQETVQRINSKSAELRNFDLTRVLNENGWEPQELFVDTKTDLPEMYTVKTTDQDGKKHAILQLSAAPHIEGVWTIKLNNKHWILPQGVYPLDYPQHPNIDVSEFPPGHCIEAQHHKYEVLFVPDEYGLYQQKGKYWAYRSGLGEFYTDIYEKNPEANRIGCWLVKADSPSAVTQYLRARFGAELALRQDRRGINITANPDLIGSIIGKKHQHIEALLSILHSQPQLGNVKDVYINHIKITK